MRRLHRRRQPRGARTEECRPRASTCACSTRKRWSRAGTRRSAVSYASSTIRFPRSPIACVHTWNPDAQRALRDVFDRGLRRHDETAVRRVVAVRREQRGAARAERAVGVELDRAHGDPPARVERLRAAREPLARQRGVAAAEHHVIAERVPPVAFERAVRLDRIVADAGIADRVESPAIALAQRRLRGARELIARRRRDRATDRAPSRCRRTRRSARRARRGGCGRRRDRPSTRRRRRLSIAFAFASSACPSMRYSTTGGPGSPRSARRATETPCPARGSGPSRRR